MRSTHVIGKYIAKQLPPSNARPGWAPKEMVDCDDEDDDDATQPTTHRRMAASLVPKVEEDRTGLSLVPGLAHTLARSLPGSVTHIFDSGRHGEDIFLMNSLKLFPSRIVAVASRCRHRRRRPIGKIDCPLVTNMLETQCPRGWYAISYACAAVYNQAIGSRVNFWLL